MTFGLFVKILFSVLIGGAIGTILSLATWTKKLSQSNNLGDSCGSFDDYAARIDYICKNDWVDRNAKNSFLKTYGRDFLKERGVTPVNDYSFIDDVIPDDEELPDVDIPLFKPLQ